MSLFRIAVVIILMSLIASCSEGDRSTLAAKMFAGHEIAHDDVLAALGVTDGGEPRSLQLSMIASGATPRPLQGVGRNNGR